MLMAIPITSTYADVIMGPGSISGVGVPISVTSITGPTSIVGSTTVTSTGTIAGANVAGSILTLDSLLGPSPGPILIQTNNGNALNAVGGNINASNNVQLQTIGGHGAIAESGGIITLNAGTSIATGAFNAVGLGAS